MNRLLSGRSWRCGFIAGVNQEREGSGSFHVCSSFWSTTNYTLCQIPDAGWLEVFPSGSTWEFGVQSLSGRNWELGIITSFLSAELREVAYHGKYLLPRLRTAFLFNVVLGAYECHAPYLSKVGDFGVRPSDGSHKSWVLGVWAKSFSSKGETGGWSVSSQL